MIALRGILTAKTPFMIGSGESEGSDVDILRNKSGEVFIPGTSLAGVCRDYLEDISTETKYVFGYGATRESSDEKERGCREMASIKEGGVTQNESHLPKFLHKKRWLTITIFLRYML